MKRLLLHSPEGKLFEAISSVMAEQGYATEFYTPETVVSRSDTLLVIGLDRWWNPELRRALESAGRLGVRRCLWQLEPLLPPSSRPPLKRQIDRALSARGRSFRIASFFENLQFERIRWAARSEPWFTSALTGHAFKIPTHQSFDTIAAARANAFDRIYVSLAPRQQFLSEFGVDSDFLPVGYCPAFGRPLPVTEREIDVLFLGRLSNRRRHYLKKIGKTLDKAGYKLRIVDRDCFGEQRDRLLNRAKVLVNLLKFPWEFPGMRLLMAMGCKTEVVSELAPDTKPYKAGLHFTMCPPEELGDVLVRRLADNEDRERITEEAHRFVTQELRLSDVLSKALAC